MRSYGYDTFSSIFPDLGAPSLAWKVSNLQTLNFHVLALTARTEHSKLSGERATKRGAASTKTVPRAQSEDVRTFAGRRWLCSVGAASTTIFSTRSNMGRTLPEMPLLRHTEFYFQETSEAHGVTGNHTGRYSQEP